MFEERGERGPNMTVSILETCGIDPPRRNTEKKKTYLHLILVDIRHNAERGRGIWEARI